MVNGRGLEWQERYRLALRYARRHCYQQALPRDVALDIAQDVCVVALVQAARTPRDSRAIRAWLYRAARLKTYEYVRSFRREREAVAMRAARDRWERLPGSLRRTRFRVRDADLRRILTTGQYRLVRMYLRGMTVCQMSSAQNTTERAVYAQLARAKTRLRAYLTEHECSAADTDSAETGPEPRRRGGAAAHASAGG